MYKLQEYLALAPPGLTEPRYKYIETSHLYSKLLKIEYKHQDCLLKWIINRK